MVFNYPLRKAQEEDYFRPIRYRPVFEFTQEKGDAAIASQAVEVSGTIWQGPGPPHHGPGQHDQASRGTRPATTGRGTPISPRRRLQRGHVSD